MADQSRVKMRNRFLTLTITLSCTLTLSSCILIEKATLTSRRIYLLCKDSTHTVTAMSGIAGGMLSSRKGVLGEWKVMINVPGREMSIDGSSVMLTLDPEMIEGKSREDAPSRGLRFLLWRTKYPSFRVENSDYYVEDGVVYGSTNYHEHEGKCEEVR